MEIPVRCCELIIFIIAGGFFSALETAFSYCNRIRMKTLAEEGDKSAARVVSVTDDFDRFIATVLIVINVLHVLASFVATVIALTLFPESSAAATAVSTVLLTIIVFFVSETVPKSIAKENCDAMARVCSRFAVILMKVLFPLSFILMKIGDLFKKLVPKDRKEPSITEEELSDIVGQAECEGVLEPQETRIIKKAIEFGDTTVGDIYTKTEDCVCIDINLRPEEIKEILLGEKFSRIPVYDHDTSHPLGILRTKEYLSCLMNLPEGEEPPEIRPFLSQAYTARTSEKLGDLFESMGRRRAHFAIVCNQRGAMVGVVTMEDILEEIVGEIYDEDDNVPAADAGEVTDNV